MWSPLTTTDKWHLIVLQSPGLDISSPVDNIHQQSPHDSGNDIHKKIQSSFHSHDTYQMCIKVDSELRSGERSCSRSPVPVTWLLYNPSSHNGYQLTEWVALPKS